MASKTSAQLDREIREAVAAPRSRSRGHAKRADPAILVREDSRRRWRQYMVVTDQRVAVVHMDPSIGGGWNFGRVTIQGRDDWPNMSRDQIVAWKMRHDDLARHATNLDPHFRDKLLDRAGL